MDFGIGEILGFLGPALGAVSSGANLIRGLTDRGPKTENIPATIGPPPTAMPSAASTITGASVAPGTSPTDFTKSQTAYWQQLLSGMGQGSELPASIQSNIERQAELIK